MFGGGTLREEGVLCAAGMFAEATSRRSQNTSEPAQTGRTALCRNADYNVAPTTYQPIIRQSREIR